ncbi:MAG: nucleotidyltransferase family protein [Methyloceanibacter sp.]|nr:nucleotidyltransferase family protein [Methyloceanibacter sp.]
MQRSATCLSEFAAIVLAAGASRRMQGKSKLLEPLRGSPLLAHSLRVVTDLGLSDVLVVVRPDTAVVTALGKDWPVTWVSNQHADEGMGTSIAAGISSLPETTRGAFVVLGDMPFVGRSTYKKLAQAFCPDRGTTICAPMYGDRLGQPVLFGQKHFTALGKLRGDVGGRALLQTYANEVERVAVDDCHVLTDLDELRDFTPWNRFGLGIPSRNDQ